MFWTFYSKKKPLFGARVSAKAALGTSDTVARPPRRQASLVPRATARHTSPSSQWPARCPRTALRRCAPNELCPAFCFPQHRMRPSPRKLAPTPSAHTYTHDVYRNTIYRHTVCTHPGAPRDTVGWPAHCTCGRCALVGGGQGGRCGREQRWSASSGVSHVECAVREGVSGAAGSVGSRRACALTLQKEGSIFMFIN